MVHEPLQYASLTRYSAFVSDANTKDRIKILAAIHQTSNYDEAAKKLGISRRTLQNRMRSLGMTRGKAGRPKRKLGYRGKGVIWAAAAATVAVSALVIGKSSST